jgi:DNA (cytosine-5)-methyltransferase 1
LVNICNVKGKDLEIVDTDKYEYIMTYSFPCQDLSLAGKGKGMARDSGTRSGMLWEVERILDELKNNNMELPQILLMENVPQVIGTENVANFNEWQLKLEQLGYKNYHKNLIATDYGIPQTRNRTFMISILGDYSYTFPKPIPLKLKLKDMLEDNVDEKYYLSERMINGMLNTSFESYKLENKLLDKDGIANTIVARFDGCPQVVGTYQYSKSENFMKGKDRFQDGKDISDTLQTTPKEGIVYNNLRIRKLSTREVFRLMGVKDEDYENIAKNQSDSSLYHLAGDSIIVNVLMAIFKEILGD